eukprot:1915979-Amphidinium_carterae.1
MPRHPKVDARIKGDGVGEKGCARHAPRDAEYLQREPSGPALLERRPSKDAPFQLFANAL